MHRAAALLALSLTGCGTFYYKQMHADPPRREAKKLAKWAALELVAGALIGGASIVWFENTEPTGYGESNAENPRLFAVLGIVAGAALFGSGLGDGTVAATQAVTNNYVFQRDSP